MKPLKQVEATRRLYHQDASLTSVHRSALMVPELAHSAAEISFLNHFLIKRDIPQVACRITAVGLDGRRIESHLHQVSEARVYTIPLTGMVDSPVASYLIEFYAAENLFIPFPAVIINHRGSGFLNTVHSYNRVLNDVFEDDEINAIQVAEASVDVKLDWETDTFAVFTAGFQRCRGNLEFELDTAEEIYEASVELDVPRFYSQEISLKELFPKFPLGCNGILKVRQPPQFMFYGRMLMGQRHADGAFSANHSFYDSSDTKEYWENNMESSRLYPFLPDFYNSIRMYPIMSPGTLEVSTRLYDHDGRHLTTAIVGELESPGHIFLDASIDAAVAAEGIRRSDVASFEVSSRPLSGRTPTRINHQLVYGGETLQSSINCSLANPNVWIPKGKTGKTWGQMVIGAGIDSWLGIVGSTSQTTDSDVEIVFYGPEGELASQHRQLTPNGSIVVKLREELGDGLGDLPDESPTYIWYVVRGSDPGLTAFVVNCNNDTGHCSGEHCF